MVSVHWGAEPALSQRPIIDQLLYIYGSARYSAAPITFCPEMKAANEKNWAIVQKWGQARISWESWPDMICLWNNGAWA